MLENDEHYYDCCYPLKHFSPLIKFAEFYYLFNHFLWFMMLRLCFALIN